MNHRGTESIAKDPRDRMRFRGVVTTTASCAWCSTSFTYERHCGRTRDFCSPACSRRMIAARARAATHYLTGRVLHRPCPPQVNCWMCSGDFRGGPPLTAAELPFGRRSNGTSQP
jgi:hypothetical protein